MLTLALSNLVLASSRVLFRFNSPPNPKVKVQHRELVSSANGGFLSLNVQLDP